MGVSLCTGPIKDEELQAVMLGGELEIWGRLLAPVPSELSWIVTLVRHFCEEYKHSASVQSLLITPKTVNSEGLPGEVVQMDWHSFIKSMVLSITMAGMLGR